MIILNTSVLLVEGLRGEALAQAAAPLLGQDLSNLVSSWWGQQGLKQL